MKSIIALFLEMISPAGVSFFGFTSGSDHDVSSGNSRERVCTRATVCFCCLVGCFEAVQGHAEPQTNDKAKFGLKIVRALLFSFFRAQTSYRLAIGSGSLDLNADPGF